MFNYQDLLKRIDQAGSPQGLPQMPQSMVGVDPSGGINNVQAAMQQGMMPPVPTAVPQMQPATLSKHATGYSAAARIIVSHRNWVSEPNSRQGQNAGSAGAV
jgi:hypothetical protein